MAMAGLRRDRFVAAADCEQDCGRFLAQPINSWSSLGYLAAGAAVFASTGRSCGRERRGVPGIFAAALAANAPGGVAYHGPGGAFGRWLHDAALVSTLSSMTVWNVVPARSSGLRPAVSNVRLAAVGTGGLAAAVLAVRPCASGPLQLVTGAAAGVSEAGRLNRLARSAHASEGTNGWRIAARELAPMAVVGAGAVLQLLSRTGGPLCRPPSRWQGHAGWHLLSAAGLGWWGVRRAGA